MMKGNGEKRGKLRVLTRKLVLGVQPSASI